jgi:hypothetical protein
MGPRYKVDQLLFITIFLLLNFLILNQIVYASSKTINQFDAAIIIQQNGKLSVIERIVYDFNASQKHEIFRNIPLISSDGSKLKIEITDVTDENGKSYNYTVSLNNNFVNIKIGDPNIFVSGVKTYFISYQVSNAIRTLDDHNEIYWNLINNQREEIIHKANINVILPSSSIPNIKIDCFTNNTENKEKNCVFHQTDNIVYYSITKPLNINEDFAIFVSIPRGYIDNSETLFNQSKFINSNILFKILLYWIIWIILVILFRTIRYLFFKFINNPQTNNNSKIIIPNELINKPITVEHEPPDNLSPIEIGMLTKQKIDINDIASIIIDLVIRGYIKIQYIVQQIQFLPDKKDFELVKIKDGSNLTNPVDKIIFNFLFNNRQQVKLSDIKINKNMISVVEEKIGEQLCLKNYFDKKQKEKVDKLERYLAKILPFFLFFFIPLCIAIAVILSKPWLFFVMFAIFAILLDIILPNKYKLTPQGINVIEKILGFTKFLQLTYQNRLQVLNAPEVQPEKFEEFLPYAMVLGIKNQWTKIFQKIYQEETR